MKQEKDIKLIISQELKDKLKKCVNKARPNEACGFMFGTIKEIKKNREFEYHYLAQKFYCMESSKKSPVSFLISDFERFNEIFMEASQQFKLQLISIFHSHPGGAYPSGVDHNNMKFLDQCGINAFKSQIWTIMDASNFELNGFIYLNNELFQIDILTLS
ncbi:MAG: Mov34/MPN/PAD-1 family protein [Promethearchaeota archaeon]